MSNAMRAAKKMFTFTDFDRSYWNPHQSPTLYVLNHPVTSQNYLQEVGRADRRGFNAKNVVYYRKSDILAKVPGIKGGIVDLCTATVCIRQCIVKDFVFTKNAPVGCKCCNICL